MICETKNMVKREIGLTECLSFVLLLKESLQQGETPIIGTDTDDITIAPIIEESDNTTEERYSLINETDT